MMLVLGLATSALALGHQHEEHHDGVGAAVIAQ